jgi:hypothetical protein
MQTKLKNANGFVRFLLNHGEKLGIAAVLAVAGLLVYSSLGRERLDDTKQAEPLTRLTSEAQNKVQNMTWNDLPEDERTDVTKFIARSGELSITPVKAEDFPRIPPFNPSVIEEMKLRADPVLLTVTDVEANGGSGLWMSADPAVIKEKMREAAKEAAQKAQKERELAEREAAEAEDGEGRRGRRGRDGAFGGEGRDGYMGGDFGGMKTRDGALVVTPQSGAQMQGFEDIRERSWVTVLAKVPIKAQFQMYEDALAGTASFNAQNDQPQYLGYIVQRAEITANGQGKWEDLKGAKGRPGVDAAGILGVMSTWPIQTPELVTPKYVHPLLTFPLPPMVIREWGDEITHSDMPLQTPEEQAEEQMREMEEAQRQPVEEEDDSENPFASVYEKMTQPQSYGYGGERGMFGGRGGESGYMGAPMGGRGGYGREGGEGGRMGMGAMGGMGAGISALPEKQWDGRTEYYLFRYFDSTVKPGHRYRYRVRLAFLDANVRQVARYLDPEVTSRLEQEKKANAAAGKAANPNGFRLTEWSDPSPVAVVPASGEAFLASIKPANANNINSEPEARMVVKGLNAELAAEVALADMFRRGAVLNKFQRAQVIWSSLYKPDPTQPNVESPEFEFITGQTLVDFDGGEALTSKNRSLTAPARALIMDAAGRIRLRNELSDQEDVQPFDMIIQASEEAARRQRSNERGPRGGRGS